MLRTYLIQHLPDPHGPELVPSGPISSSRPTGYSPAAIELMGFKKGIKRQIAAYPSLKDERYFDGFKRSLLIVAKTHECNEVLEPNYTPGSEPEEQELFEAKQNFMFSVFNANLRTDMGKTIVRRHLANTDAQSVWKELSEHMRTSSKGALEKRRLTQYVTNTVLDDNLKGITEQFVLHFNEQFRQLDEISDAMKILKAYNTEAISRFHQRKVHNTEIVETRQNDLPEPPVHENDLPDLPESDLDIPDDPILDGACEQIPHDIPKPLGKHVQTTHYVDANLHHDLATGKAVTAVLHFLNQTPIDAYTKRQSTVATATYGSEFVAARTAVDQIIDIRTTLRYLGVPIRDKSYMFGDNRSVVTSSTIPNSTISKRHHLASYHRVREAIAAKYISFHWKDGKSNPADILSKHWEFATVWPMLKPILFWRGKTATQLKGSDRIPSTNPGAEPPRDAKDSGSARSHSTHLETSSSDRP